MASSVRAPRSANGTPSASNPSSSHPAAAPNNSRPPLNASTVASSLARCSGCRYGRTITLVPSRTRVVAAPAHVSATTGSSRYAGGYGTPVGIARWSLTHTSAKPSSSACFAARVMPSAPAARPYCGKWTPNCTGSASVVHAGVLHPQHGRLLGPLERAVDDLADESGVVAGLDPLAHCALDERGRLVEHRRAGDRTVVEREA